MFEIQKYSTKLTEVVTTISTNTSYNIYINKALDKEH